MTTTSETGKDSNAEASAATLAGVTRPAFLLLPVICVALGGVLAMIDGAGFAPLRLLVVLLGAVSAHVAVNALNEVADFHSGLDFTTERTPFSGGSGTLVERPELARAARWLGLMAVLITLLCGLFLMVQVGVVLLPFGLLGLFLVLGYSGPILRRRTWVLAAPGLGFGSLMVLGTVVALGGELSGLAVAASTVVFFLTSNLLLLNQFPDREPDREIGRDNVVIYSLPLAARVYGLFVLGALAALGWAAYFEPLALVAAVALVPAIIAWRAARRFEGDIATLLPALGMNVAVSLATPALLAVALSVGFFLES